MRRHAAYAIVVLGLWIGVTSAPRVMACDDAGERLHALFEREWERWMRENPVWASRLGDRRYNQQWTDLSLEAIERRHEHNRAILRELEAFDPAALSPADRLNLRLFRHHYEQSVELHGYRWWLVPLDHRHGAQTLNDLTDSLRFATVQDYEDWIARLHALPAYIDQTIVLMQRGIAEGIVHARPVMVRVPRQVRSHIVDDPRQSLFYAPFEHYPEAFTEADRQRLSVAAQRAIAQHIVPTYERFAQFIEDEYLPACYEQPGVWQIPEGRAFYAAQARVYTTTDLTPRQIHAIGLSEVQRIRNDMKQIIEQVDFTGSFHEFLEFLRTDPQFYVDDREELLRRYRALAKRIDPLIVKLFRTMPRAPYGVEPIPDHIAPDTTTAYYQRPAADGSRAGTFYVNTYRPRTRPLYEMEALTLHEGVPGHHFQIALAMEMEDLPKFRRYRGYTAYIEGWGLYAESLGNELGLYQDPYSRFGQLTYEMWRACRLVVDTGLHEMGWSRQQAIDFLKDNAAKTEHDIINEIDRYIAWPGQALAYKIGELEITALRERAAAALGDQFDIREFHEVVLRNGALPLDVLAEEVQSWLEHLIVTADEP